MVICWRASAPYEITPSIGLHNITFTVVIVCCMMLLCVLSISYTAFVMDVAVRRLTVDGTVIADNRLRNRPFVSFSNTE